jgi:hypothetical protein
MKFHLNFAPEKSPNEINHTHNIFLIGSCFTENIAHKLTEYEFKTYSNPSGILFNPASILHCLNSLIQEKAFDEKHLLQRDTTFLSYQHHSFIHASDKNQLTEKINSENAKAVTFLKESNFLIITFGTAFTYRHLELNEVVANCHKQASSVFEKKLLEVNTIVNDYSLFVLALQKINPNLNILLTVSPVKHLKDGVVENNVSKATLLLSIHELVKKHSNCSYFPAYELVTDDLRDYRFYKQDLAHPNDMAINYVWEKFSDCFFSAETKQFNQGIQKLNAALNHRSNVSSPKELEKLNDFIDKQKRELYGKY